MHKAESSGWPETVNPVINQAPGSLVVAGGFR
jgi:hypothetical protein